MEKTFRVTVISESQSDLLVSALIDLVSSRPYPFVVSVVSDIFDLDLEETDALLDVTNNIGLYDLYKSVITSKVLLVSANSFLMAEHGIELSELAKSLESKLYLNSLFAGSSAHKLLNINEKNIKNYSAEEISKSRSSEISVVASSIYQDLVRAHNKWDPSYEQARRNREIQRKEATKQNLYEVAKSLNVELEAQPCGIDPKLPDVKESHE